MYGLDKPLNMKRIFIISEHVNPEENSTGYYWFSIIRAVSKKFGKADVICPAKNKYRHANAFGKETSPEKNNLELFHEYPGVCLHPVKFLPTSNGNILLRLYQQFLLTSKFILKILKFVRHDDVVICGTNPALLMLVLPILKKFKNFKWLLLVHDVFPENLIPARIISRKNVIYSLAKIYFDFAYASADKVVVIGRDMKDLIDGKINRTDRTIFVPNWVDPDEVFPISKNASSFINDAGWQGKTVFQFFGNMGRLQGIDNLLEAIRKVTHKNAAFLFVGDGVMVPRIKKFINDNPDIPILHFGAVSLKDKNKVLSACDVAFVTLERGMLGLGVPSKSYFSLAADKPLIVVAEAESEVARMVAESNVGWCCNPDQPDTLSSIINKICSLELADFHGRQRELILGKYSEKMALNSILKCISDEFIL